MKKLLSLLALGAIAASSAQAQITLLVDDFNYGSSEGTSIVGTSNNDTANTSGGYGGWAKNVAGGTFLTGTDLESQVGSYSGVLSGTVAASVYRSGSAIQNPASGVITKFYFTVSDFVGASNGNRIMFEAATSSTNNGYGINFDYSANGDNPSLINIVSYNRIGTTNNTTNAISLTAWNPSANIYVEGTFTRTAASTGSMTVNFYSDAGLTSLLGSQTSASTTIGTPGTGVVIKLNAANMGFTVDDINFVQVPEPSTIALMFGLGALGFVMYRRRRA